MTYANCFRRNLNQPHITPSYKGYLFLHHHFPFFVASFPFICQSFHVRVFSVLHLLKEAGRSNQQDMKNLQLNGRSRPHAFYRSEIVLQTNHPWPQSSNVVSTKRASTIKGNTWLHKGGTSQLVEGRSIHGLSLLFSAHSVKYTCNNQLYSPVPGIVLPVVLSTIPALTQPCTQLYHVDP